MVAIFHSPQRKTDSAHAFRSYHTLSQRIGSNKQVIYHTGGFQTQKSGTVGKTPCLIDGVMIPLPIEGKPGSGKIIRTADTIH